MVRRNTMFVLRMPLTMAILATCMLLIPTGGCSPDDGRRSVSGNVTFQGEPVLEGHVRLSPVKGTSGPVIGTRIEDGKFRTPRDDSPFAGTYRVEITGSRKTGRTIRRAPLHLEEEEYEQDLPARHNKLSERTIEVTNDGENEFDFALD